VTPDIQFPLTGDFDQNGEQAFDNALAWTSIAAANYKPTSNLSTIVPMLEARHESRTAGDKQWQALQADIADVRKLRKEASISLNEKVRREERDEQEKTRLERHPQLAASAAGAKENLAATGNTHKPADGSVDTKATAAASPGKASNDQAVAARSAETVKARASAAPAPGAVDSTQDDGLQADERSLKADLAEERKRKVEKDVALDEAAHILADEVNLIRADTKLAALVLPHTTIAKNVVD